MLTMGLLLALPGEDAAPDPDALLPLLLSINYDVKWDLIMEITL